MMRLCPLNSGTVEQNFQKHGHQDHGTPPALFRYPKLGGKYATHPTRVNVPQIR